MKLKITHTTKYTYDTPVTYALQQVRLTPTSSAQQKVLDWNVAVEGGEIELNYRDEYKNETLLIQAGQGHTEVRVIASGEVETIDCSGIIGRIYDTAPLWHFTQFTPRTTPGDAVKKLAKIIGSSDNLLNDFHELSRQIIQAVPYSTNLTSVETTVEEAVAAKGGVCQDHAQIFVSAARIAGIPARYVSGYLLMDDRVDQDATHAWAEAHFDDLGWVGFDVSNGIAPDERYVRIATALDALGAAPISGMRMGPSNESMVVSLQVQQ